MSSNKLLYILIGIISVGVIFTLVLVLRNVGGSSVQPVTLQFWGVFDDHNAFDKVIRDFKAQNPGIDVKYQMFTYEQYEKGFVNALAAGTGPDVLMIHNTWLPKHGNQLAPMPAGIPDTKNPFTAQSFKDQFVDVAYQDLVYNNQIYGMPLYIDTLALYYNKDLFNSAGIARPPTTWSEVNADIPLLTKQDGRGNLTQSAFSLGTARNINRSTDILQAMMIQSGVQMTATDHTSATFDQPVAGQHLGEIALQYYTNFANSRNQDYAWNDAQHYSLDAFTEGTLAMMLGYAHDSQVITSKAPRLNFAIAPMPQASTADVRNFANYWAGAVTLKSLHPVEAWKFVNYLASKEGITTYINATNRPVARRDLVDLQRTDPTLGVFAVQSLSARSWFQADNTAIEGIFADMIDDVNLHGSTIPSAIQRASSRVTVLMQR
jgi:multiple sugar transport system substrate-binding protein